MKTIENKKDAKAPPKVPLLHLNPCQLRIYLFFPTEDKVFKSYEGFNLSCL